MPTFAKAYVGRKRWGVALSNASRPFVYAVKASEKHHFRPMYAGANMGAPVQNLTPWLEVQSERIERIARGRQDVLASVKHVGFHCIRYLAEVGMP